MSTNKVVRRLHYWGAALAGIPIIVILGTGILLQLKKNVSWVQPAERRGGGGAPAVSFDRLLAAARSIPEAEVTGWEDIPRVEMRPLKGLIKLVSTNQTEIQIDHATGEILHTAHRRSDTIESIHDGSWFFSAAKLGIFLPAGVVLLGLWLTGLYLFILPFVARRRHRRRLAEAAARRS